MTCMISPTWESPVRCQPLFMVECQSGSLLTTLKCSQNVLVASMQDDRASHLFSEMQQSPAVSNYHGCIHRQPRMSKKIRGWQSCQRGNVTSNMQHDGNMHGDLCSKVGRPDHTVRSDACPACQCPIDHLLGRRSTELVDWMVARLWES